MKNLVCGVDEAGRGPLAGPVYAAAVILNPRRPIAGLRDSKQLTALRREALAAEICRRCVCWSVAWASVEEIDRFNILHATLLAMRRAVEALAVTPDHVQIDGNQRPKLDPKLNLSCECIVKGDETVPRISAASIIAKTHRDAYMRELHTQYPDYCFDRHFGYGTSLHLDRLEQFGASPVHRRSFAPVRICLEGRRAEFTGFSNAAPTLSVPG